ncbi:reverse transcriptase-like protein [Candidatus Peregrinibacteria bacterium]|nr:reverse transcriptase-like protein [Candidatus Peregrinibacteria bacterium]
MNNKTIIYTDGSCLGNPGPGGWAAIFIDQEGKIAKTISGHDYHTTNNRMEMMALLKSLETLKVVKDQEIEIFSDSNLLVQTLNQGWKRKANLDLWEKIDQLKKPLDISLNWVKAHHQDKYNLKVDQMAFKEAKKAEQAIKDKPDLVSDSIIEHSNQSQLF